MSKYMKLCIIMIVDEEGKLNVMVYLRLQFVLTI